MKKIFLGMIVSGVLVPSLAFASWWNPSTWFKPKTVVKFDSSMINQAPQVKVMDSVAPSSVVTSKTVNEDTKAVGPITIPFTMDSSSPAIKVSGRSFDLSKSKRENYSVTVRDMNDPYADAGTKSLYIILQLNDVEDVKSGIFSAADITCDPGVELISSNSVDLCKNKVGINSSISFKKETKTAVSKLAVSAKGTGKIYLHLFAYMMPEGGAGAPQTVLFNKGIRFHLEN